MFFFFFTKYDGSEIFKKGFRLSNPKGLRNWLSWKNHQPEKRIYIHRLPDGFVNNIATVSDKNSWDTLTKRCFFPSRAPLVPLKVVYRGLATKSCTPTLRGQGDPKVSQPFWLRLCFWGILGMWLLVGSSGGKSLGRYMHVSEPFFREKH